MMNKKNEYGVSHTSVRLFDSTILILHFLILFLLNIISALIMIINVARHRSTVQKQQLYIQQLHKQFYQFKHFLINPMVFIVLVLPQLLISFMSYVPSMLTFIVFVLLSETYIKKLKETIKPIQRHTHD
jgi:hypothetical protein